MLKKTGEWCQMAETAKVLKHIQRLLRNKSAPPLEGDLAAIPELAEIHNDLRAIRETLFSFINGDFSADITARGVIPGYLKVFQANLKHLIRQVRMVEQGDFSQRVEFMGEFSRALNNMVTRMDCTFQELKTKEIDLRALADSLRDEVRLRNTAVEALQASESRFKYLANHDPLTGALNRRSFMERAEFELKNCLSLKIPCGLVMIDIDHFKEFNDGLGHQAGDEALRHIVSIITALLRKDDFLGRYGGEEFIFFFSHADKKTGVSIAERVREAVQGNPVKLESGPMEITASFGVAMAEDITEIASSMLEALIHCADVALYAAKQAGRNRVILHGEQK
jgi:diguanylate cyclase (GGDEF)-like protein